MKNWISRNPVLFVLLLALAVRLLSLGLYPLMDTTEARYGYMARLMVETGNWLTPQFDLGVPFWGKPPLHTWMSAGSAAMLGMTEFSLRLPHWLAGVAVAGLVAWMARRQGQNPLLAAMVLATCAIFSVASGAVMTDMALTLGMTIAMLGFYLGWQGHYRAGYLGFAGLAIGLLAKGPLVIVLMGLAVAPWLLIQHGLGAFRVLWQRFPLLLGTGAMLLIAAPWYLAAEQATPGFLNYFLVGEHFLRFVESGWTGDLYGSAHDQPRGTIWLFWLAAALPWSVILPLLYLRGRGQPTRQPGPAGWRSFLLCWMVSPMVLFTMAGNILPAYVLPGIPALALLCSSLATDSDRGWLAKVGVTMPVLLLVATGVLNLKVGDERSDKALLAKEANPALPLLYYGKRTFSGQFYSDGRAQKADLVTLNQQRGRYSLVMSAKQSWQQLALESQSCRVMAVKLKRQLLECGPDALASLD
ncbi:Dolichyl-phosphate-mannose-protein mannosyltransferase [Ferrimonas sediminum]|uniref:Dolichyl-phosphate-mannose-protein mannosyltransferase n=1 Tax=Ferrimonas sediminum TaxID=718193 RepID=A0A1G8WXF5_9GAMM|nr:glycosyltransferase family 39 protein [Ferrimonas sediminum]SDJ82893.1 Dolichyl-phosphate-mannose-protein mannosyltransferase [Ferrimonas sediminum]